jgi:hypothetical protein
MPGLVATTDNQTNRRTDDVTATPLETHTPDRFMGSWCNRQHGGLLIRMAWVQFPLDALMIQDVGKSGIPPALDAGDRWFESSRPD